MFVVDAARRREKFKAEFCTRQNFIMKTFGGVQARFPSEMDFDERKAFTQLKGGRLLVV